MIFLVFCQAAFSQVTVPAGNTYTSLNNRPLSVNDNHERLASIYGAAELGIPAGSTITAIRYYLQSVSAPQNTPMRVFLSNRNGTSYFSMIYQNVEPSAAPNYQGTFPASAFVPGGWINIPLTTPLLYTGNNIQVLVATDGGNSITESMSAKQFRWTTGPTNSSQYWYSWTSPFDDDDYGVPESGRPNIQFFYTTAGAAGTVSFDNSTFTVSENTNAGIIVYRNGGSTGSISVDYSSRDGTATA
ncbi:MAG TPA: hypothetical protein PLA69_08860, partial [Flavobacterium sp.]|nr:hypothetical protein [Flavobacterium sp.]